METATRPGQRAGSSGAGGRDRRYIRREAHQRVSLGKTFRGCGRKLIAGAATLAGGPTGAAWTGTATCGMVHMCTWCAGRILAVRADYAQQAAEAWVAAGGGIVLTAHTLRHYSRQRYGSLRKRERGGLVAVLHDGWSGAYGHRSGKMWQRAKRAAGIVGVLRSFEDTWGEGSGWHLHFHAMWFTDRPLTDAEIADLGKVLSSRWSRAVVAAGGYAPSEARGVRVDRVELAEAGAVGRYLFKDGDHAGISQVGAEIAFGPEKSARGARLGPFELGDAAATTGEATAVDAWQEREAGVFGVRKMYLSNGMKGRLAELGVREDRTDAEIAEDDGEKREPLALFPAATWYQHIAPVVGRRLELIRAAEAGGLPAVQVLIAEWGLEWGRDVLPAPATGDAE